MEKLANEVNIFFQKVSSDLHPMSEEILKSIPLEQLEKTPIVISQEEVERRLLSTKVFKSLGPDGIPNWILHDLAPYISRPATAIFNASIYQKQSSLSLGSNQTLFQCQNQTHQRPSRMICGRFH